MIKIQRFSTGGARRGESAFTFLSDVVSLLSHVIRLPLVSLSLSPWQLLLSIARYLCHLEKAASLTSRSRRHFFFLVFDLSLLAHSKILSHLFIISSIHLRSCVTTRNFSYTLPGFIHTCDTFFVRLYKYITKLLKRFSRKVEWFWRFNAND